MRSVEAEQIAQRFIQCYLRRDLDGIGELLAQPLFWIGAEKSDVFYSFEDVCAHMRQLHGDPKVQLLLENMQVESFSSGRDTTTVLAFLRLGVEAESGASMLTVRMTLQLRSLPQGWRICCIHSSVPYFPPQDTSAVQVTRRQLEELRLRDALTGIYNMEGFVAAADQLRRRWPQNTYVFLKFGINGFRYINRTSGFVVGDQVLRHIAGHLQASCSEQETCGRVEKDIFAAMLVFRGKADMARRMEQIRAALVDEELRRQLSVEINFTAGLYLPPDLQGEEIKDMLDKALVAQQSLDSSRAVSEYVYYAPEMSARWYADSQLMAKAMSAIESGAFKLYIQPQVELATGSPAAGEALVRWQQPDGSLIMPGAFIPLFEHSEFILEFDFYMLDLLCRHLRRWLNEGRPVLPISINQSRRHLAHSRYLEDFCAVVDKYRIPHELIVFELTESTFVEYNDEVYVMARRLHEMGFLLAIDDFGTGYASLNMLSMLSADILKIDRSLAIDCEKNRRSVVILQKVVEMAHETKMIAVCEGIETAGQLDCVRQLGCDVVQGFYYARPMPAEDFAGQYLSPCAVSH